MFSNLHACQPKNLYFRCLIHTKASKILIIKFIRLSHDTVKHQDLVSGCLGLRLQQGYQASYCRKLIDWIKSCGFHRVLMLSSISATERVDSQMEGSPLRYVVSKASEGLVKDFDNLSWKRLEKKLAYPDINQGNTDEEYAYFIPGGGVAKRMFEICDKDDIPLTILLTFCSEGDNMSDAVRLFFYLNEWLAIIDRQKVESKLAGKPSDFVIPSSWSLMFGSPLAPIPLF